METLAVFLVLAIAGLVAWRWFLGARAADRAAQRVHELELHTRRVTFDQAQLDADRATVKRLEERVKTLEYRKA